MATETETRLAIVEEKLEVAIKAIHLLTVSAKPTSEWLDANVAKIEKAER